MTSNSEFLQAVYGLLETGAHGWTTAFRGDPNKVTPDAWTGAAWTGGELQEKLIDSRAADNLFFSPSIMRPVEGIRRAKRNFFQLKVLPADDVLIDNLRGIPSYVIETSPGKRQLGLLLDEDDPDTLDLKLVDAVFQSLADAHLIDADKSGNNPVRLCRLPVGTNGKGGHNWSVKLTQWNPEARYSLADACAIVGLDLEKIRAGMHTPAKQDLSQAANHAELIERITADNPAARSYHDSLLKLTASLVATGMQPGAVVNHVRGIMEAARPEDPVERERWAARYDEIPRMVAGAAQFQPTDVVIDLDSLQPMDWSSLDSNPPEPPRFIVPGWLPARTVTLLSANGGVGKSNLALQLSAALAGGEQFLGERLERHSVMFLSAEDECRVVHFRLTNICADLKAPLRVLGTDLTVFDLTERDPVMWRDTGPTAMLTWVRERVEARRPGVLVIDNASDVFAANENDRAQVRGFMRALNALARELDMSVLLLAHVDKASARHGAGADSNTSFSGSTAWNNSARSRWAMLRGPDGDVVLRHEKCNFGPLQAERRLEFDADAKVFRPFGTLPASGASELLRNQRRAAILAALKRANDAGQRISMSATANNNAYRVLAGESCVAGMKRGEFFNLLFAMQREGYVEEETYTLNRKTYQRLALTGRGLAAVSVRVEG